MVSARYSSMIAVLLCSCSGGAGGPSTAPAPPVAADGTRTGGPGAPPAGPVVTPFSLRFEPPHMSTDIGPTPLRIVVTSTTGSAVDPAITSALGSDAVVEQLAGSATGAVAGAGVPARVELAGMPPPSVGESIRLAPLTTLADGWYRIRVPRLPSGVAVEAGVPVDRLSDGSIAVRFRVGSQPIANYASVCPGKVAIQLSEPVVADSSVLAATRIAADGLPVACATPGRPADYARGIGTLGFDCPGVRPDSDVDVDIPAGLVAFSGSALSSVAGDRHIVLHLTATSARAPGDPACTTYAL